MSTDAHSHKPHVLPLSIYIGVGSALFILTGITVAVAQVNLGGAWNLVIAMVVATIKASLVVLFFMHLLYDNKLYAVVFGIGLFMLTAFIVETMFDTLRRDGIYEYRATPIKQEAEIYKNLRKNPPKQHGHDEHAPAESESSEPHEKPASY